MTATRPTLAVLRVWPDSGNLLALFPTVPADRFGRLCQSYERQGQHGAADYDGCMRATLPAAPESEAARALVRELAAIGYDLQIEPCARSYDHHQRRDEAARRNRAR